MSQYLTFELAGRYYAVGVEHINSVLDPQAITPLPHAATLVTGLTNVRGSVVPVFDPRQELAAMKVDESRLDQLVGSAQDESAYDDTADSGIVVFETENGTMLPFIGLVADRIGKVIQLSPEQIAAVPSFLPEAASIFLDGFCFVGKERHAILKLAALVSRDVLFRLEGVTRG